MRPSFDTGVMAGRAFVHVVRELAASRSLSPASASVGIREDGSVEVLRHRDALEAATHCFSAKFTTPCLFEWWELDSGEVGFNLRPYEKVDGELRVVASLECVARFGATTWVKLIDSLGEDLSEFLDGFAEGSIADKCEPVLAGLPLRLRAEEDADRLGFAVGQALAGDLMRRLNGEPPCDSIGILFLLGDDRPTIHRSDVSPLRENALCRHRAKITRLQGNRLSIYVPSEWGGNGLYAVGIDAAIKRGVIQTSTLAPVMPNPHAGYAPFLRGIDDGLRRDPNVAAGIGALGEYRHEDGFGRPARKGLFGWFRR